MNNPKTILIKIGGSLMEENESLQELCKKIRRSADAGFRIFTVHGGGKTIEHYQKLCGISSVFQDGLRVTDEETMKISEMVLSGLVSKDLVSRFTAAEIPAVGISGRDGSLISARKFFSKGTDYGRVGEITKVNPAILHLLSDAGFFPVISPIGNDPNYRALNINADTAASEIAAALKVDLFLFFTDVDGILKENRLIPQISSEEIETLIDQQVITGGMIPKVRGMLRALEAGVGEIRILNGKRIHEFSSLESKENPGTFLYSQKSA